MKSEKIEVAATKDKPPRRASLGRSHNMRIKAWSGVKGLYQSENGATAIEYALIAALAAAGIAGGMAAIAELAQLVFELINSAIEEVASD